MGGDKSDRGDGQRNGRQPEGFGSGDALAGAKLPDFMVWFLPDREFLPGSGRMRLHWMISRPIFGVAMNKLGSLERQGDGTIIKVATQARAILVLLGEATLGSTANLKHNYS